MSPKVLPALLASLAAIATGASGKIMLRTKELTPVNGQRLPDRPGAVLQFAESAPDALTVAGPADHPNRRILGQINGADQVLAAGLLWRALLPPGMLALGLGIGLWSRP